MSKNNITNINNEIIIKRILNEKYLGNQKLMKLSSFSLGDKKFNIYHFILAKKQSIYKLFNFNNNDEINLAEEHMNLLEKINNNAFILNDLVSHASSGNNSITRNTLISYNKEIKKIHKNENETKELKIVKIILLLVISIFLIFLVILSFLLNISYQNYEKANDFYLSFSDYSNMFHNLFFSSLSISCIAIPNERKNCENYFSDIPGLIIKKIYPEYMDYISTEEDYEL